ncbi:Extracellular membrane protein CFEM domain-containing protein (Fragment) [Madurella fahalii]|uniref:Extracellular membrane protein CFEM domain-containing protein n=1 Tax=Madurella fahalii TaxID=1157608 RepID=A0ABQ0GN60_9PEZI
MADFRRLRVLTTAVTALILISASQAADVIDFSFYPEGARDCLYEAADASSCESSSVAATNSCLCRNGGDFITNTAACLTQSSPSELRTVYRTMRDACDNSETPISITEDEFMDAAGGVTSTSSIATSTTSTTTSATSITTASTTTASTTTSSSASTDTIGAALPGEDEQGGSGLSTGAMVGIIVGATIAGLALLGGLALFLLRRRRKLGEESHPMLPEQSGHISFPPTTPGTSGYFGSPPDTALWPKKDWGQSPNPADVRASGFNWESPAHLAYPGGYAAAPSSPPQPPIQELDSVVLHPTGTTEAPAEIGGTPVGTVAPPHTQFSYPGPAQPEAGWHQPPR